MAIVSTSIFRRCRERLASALNSAFIVLPITLPEGARHAQHFPDPTQHAILAHAAEHAEGRIEWFPANINGGARQKVLDGLAKRELIRQAGKRWRVAAAGYDALGIARPGVGKQRVGSFEAQLDQIIANAEGAQPAPTTRN